MAPDDPSGVRELRFNFNGHYHVIITASPDGTGTIEILDDFSEPTDKPTAKRGVKDAVVMLSIARRIAWDEFIALGGTIEELRK